MVETLEYYKMINNSIQFLNAELVSLNCIKHDFDSKEESEKDIDFEVKILLRREVNIVSENKADIFLHSKVGIPDGPFDFDVTYKGLCVTNQELNKNSFEQYAYNQVVPLLLPYVRECISSTMARMGLPIFTLPTIDVLDSIEANMGSEFFEEE